MSPARDHLKAVRVSVVVPVHNGAELLRECLSALQASARPDTEIIVVDDGSTDGSGCVAGRMAVRVLRLGKNLGPAAARNRGARSAKGEILFFVDADVAVAADAVDRVVRGFEEHPDVAALFGSYDDEPRAGGIVSPYRNLLHHFVHQSGRGEASTFWAGCGAIRRRVFQDVGGFDERRYTKPSIEDIELGRRLRQAGHRILLDGALRGTHLKRWTLRSVLWTDFARRAVPWSRLIVETGTAPDDLNLNKSQRLSVALVALAVLSAALCAVRLELAAVCGLALLGVALLNRRFYAFLYRKRGLAFASACLPLHFLYFLEGGLGYVYARVCARQSVVAGQARRIAGRAVRAFLSAWRTGSPPSRTGP